MAKFTKPACKNCEWFRPIPNESNYGTCHYHPPIGEFMPTHIFDSCNSFAFSTEESKQDQPGQSPEADIQAQKNKFP
jgi:hypothetical protein